MRKIVALLCIVFLVACGSGNTTNPPNEEETPTNPVVEGFTILSASAATNTSVELVFNQEIAEGADNITNYSVSPELTVTAAVLDDTKKIVTLTTSAQQELDYVVTVTNLKDSTGASLNDDSKASFSGLVSTNPSDTVRPIVESVTSLDSATLLVTFSEKMGLGAEVLTSYNITAPAPPEPQNLQTQAINLNLKAAQISEDGLQVTLTTFSQSNIEYTLVVANVRDLAGNLVETNTFTFTGKPTSGAPLNSDEDELNDIQEQTGWFAVIFNKGVKTGSEHVTSDPSLADTDEDGILDHEEFSRKMNPRSQDSDGDGLSDTQEVQLFLTNPTDTDTDKDGLSDGDEVNGKIYKVNGVDVLIKTNPLLADTDGDDFSDFYEVTTANRDPRTADLPTFEFDIGEINITPNITIEKFKGTTQTDTETFSETITLEEGTTNEFSTSDAFTDNWFAKAGATVGFEASTGTEGFSVSGEASIEGGLGGDNTFSASQASINSSINTYSDTFETSSTAEDSESVTRTVNDGLLAVNVRVRNTSNVAFTMNGLEITALKQKYGVQDTLNYENVTVLEHSTAGTFSPLTLQLGPAGTSEGESGILTFFDPAIAGNAIEDLILDPRGIVFDVANYTITTNTDGIERSFNDQLQNVNDRTAHLKIDYGAGRRGEVEDYRVATFNPADNSGGVPLSFVLEEILNLKHFDEDTAPNLSDAEKESSYSTKTINGVETLWRIRTIERNEAINQIWLMIVQEGTGQQTTSSFDPNLAARDFILKPEVSISIALHIDADGDGVPARLERKLGSSDNEIDSDGDELSDNFEAYADWFIRVNEADKSSPTGVRQVTRTVRSSPALADTDGDGLDDRSEFLSRADFIELANKIALEENGIENFFPSNTGTPNTWLTDPTRPDTDLDFVSDLDEFQSSFQILAGNVVRAIIPSLDPNDADTDGDSLLDGVELDIGSNPVASDAESVRDTDLDGLTDADETASRSITLFGQNTLGTTGVLSGSATRSLTVTSDPNLEDTDGDGLSDKEEFDLGTNPRRSDTDGDGLNDKAEVDAGLQANNADSDRDGLNDGFETNESWIVSVVGASPVSVKSDPTKFNSDTDTFSDRTEFLQKTNPTDSDTDKDSTIDSREANLGRNPLAKDRRVTLSYVSLGVSDDCDSDPFNALETGGAGDYAFSLEIHKNNTLLIRQSSGSLDRAACTSIDETSCKKSAATSVIPGRIQIGNNQTLRFGSTDLASRNVVITEADTLKLVGFIQEIDLQSFTGKVVADFTQSWNQSQSFSQLNQFTNGSSINITSTMSQNAQCKVTINVQKVVE